MAHQRSSSVRPDGRRRKSQALTLAFRTARANGDEQTAQAALSALSRMAEKAVARIRAEAVR